MPAVSPAQRRLFAIAEHAPNELFKRNQSLASLPRQTLHDFASTPNSAMPKQKKPKVVAVVKVKPVHPMMRMIAEH